MDDQRPGGGPPAEDPDGPRPRPRGPLEEDESGSGRVFLVDRRVETDTRGPWIGVGVAAVLVAAGAAFVLLGPLLGGGDPSGSGAEPGAAVSAAADTLPSADTSPAAAASTPGADADRPEAVADFVRQANSVEAALSRYEERRALFEEGRLGCEGLGAAHDAVDRTFVAVALTVRNRGGQLDDGARARFDELASRADAADRHFAGSACSGTG